MYILLSRQGTWLQYVLFLQIVMTPLEILQKPDVVRGGGSLTMRLKKKN